jgi:hypothetical protein
LFKTPGSSNLHHSIIIMMRISSAVLVSSVVAQDLSGMAKDVVVDGLSQAGLDQESGEQIVELAEQAFNAVGEAFTHERTICVSVETPDALADQFERLSEYKDDSVEFGWEHTDTGMVMIYHNDGPISGCQGFKLPGCGWELFVAASNPLMGKNKARVAFLPPDSGKNCEGVWDTMDSWGETDGVEKNDYWDTYDNPSTISYKLTPPDECLSSKGGSSKTVHV